MKKKNISAKPISLKKKSCEKPTNLKNEEKNVSVKPIR